MGGLHSEVSSPGAAAFIGFAAQARPSLPGLRAPELPLLTPFILVLIQVTQWGRKVYEFGR